MPELELAWTKLLYSSRYPRCVITYVGAEDSAGDSGELAFGGSES